MNVANKVILNLFQNLKALGDANFVDFIELIYMEILIAISMTLYFISK